MSDKLMKAFAKDNAGWLTQDIEDNFYDTVSDIFNNNDLGMDYNDQVKATELLMKEVLKTLNKKWKS